jgi:cytochrome c-type biogenesis protein CcmF
MHYFIGNLGHLLVITAFVTSLLSAFAYWKATTLKEIEGKNSWLINARFAFGAHVLGVFGVVAVLF